MFDPVALGIPPQTSIQIVWIDLAEEEAKARMIKRADPRDEWKLAHWNEYAKRRIEPPTHTLLKRFDNSQFDDTKLNILIEAIIQ